MDRANSQDGAGTEAGAVDDQVTVGIAAAVRAHRQAAGLSMRALAAKAGMSQPFLSNLENSRAMPSIATLYKIAAALGVSPRDFLPAEAGTVSVLRAGFFEHDGEDLLVVLDGEVDVDFADGRRVALAAGDVLWHAPTVPHRWTSRGQHPARLLVVNARPAAPSATHG
ncbi:MAG: XRE family transcriptional regulator [Ilumatobacteraceae bacterium]